MIIYKKAPLGFIAHIHENKKTSVSSNGYVGRRFLDVTGSWSPTLEKALVSVKKEIPKKVKKIDVRISKLLEEIKDLEYVKGELLSDQSRVEDTDTFKDV